MASGDEDDRRSASRSRSPPRSRSRSRSDRRRSPSRSRSKRSDDRGRSRSRDGGSDERVKGKVMRWHPRGFGFIKPDGKEEDIFVHVSAITDGNALRENDTVEFVLLYDPIRKKERADKVTGGYTEDRPPPRRDDRGYGGDRYGGRGGGGRSRDDDYGRGRDRYDSGRDRGYDRRNDDRRRDRDRYEDRGRTRPY